MERLYDIWLEKIQSQATSGDICIYKEGNRIAGMLTCEWQESHSRIQLLAVHSTDQRKGIGRILLAHHEHQASKRNTDQIIVKTQTGNTKACRLYESAGFIEEKRSYLYHFHAKSKPAPRNP
jgi:ribosomal protein S18 acetylase RimI-like enzyme